MVLQREQPISFWGRAAPESSVIVTFGEESAEVTSNEHGSWQVTFHEREAGGPFVINISSGDDCITIRNVKMGDVWLCSGQSNMGWTMIKSANGAKAVAKVDQPDIRVFDVVKSAANKPMRDLQGCWLPATPESIRDFSAVAWYFGSSIHASENVPVGLILSEVGGTLANNWTSKSQLDRHPNIERYRERYWNLVDDYPQVLREYEKTLLDNPYKSQPKKPSFRQPSGYFNAMIAPLQPLPLKGVIWYQGETDSWSWPDYSLFFEGLIQDWRNGFRNPELPFLYVMLAGFEGKVGAHENYPHIREAQYKALQLTHTAMASALDVGERDNIHPLDKKTVGQRLALAAKATVYGRDVCYMGPEMKRVSFENGRGIVEYKNATDGLCMKGEKLTAFQLCGPDGVYHDADANLVGDHVVVSCTSVSEPIHMRYAWAGYPEINLYNSYDLPALPFRTDAFSEIPHSGKTKVN